MASAPPIPLPPPANVQHWDERARADKGAMLSLQRAAHAYAGGHPDWVQLAPVLHKAILKTRRMGAQEMARLVEDLKPAVAGALGLSVYPAQARIDPMDHWDWEPMDHTDRLGFDVSPRGEKVMIRTDFLTPTAMGVVSQALVEQCLVLHPELSLRHPNAVAASILGRWAGAGSLELFEALSRVVKQLDPHARVDFPGEQEVGGADPADYYDGVSAVGAAAQISVLSQAKSREIVTEFLQGLPRGASLLDVGSGATDVARLARDDFGLAVVPVDLSPRLVEAAREQGFAAVCADATRLSFCSAESQDAALQLFVSVHLNPHALEQSLGELYRVLKPGGWALVAVNLSDAPQVFSHVHGRVGERGQVPTTRFYTHELVTLKADAKRQGFQVPMSQHIKPFPGVNQAFFTLHKPGKG